MKLRAYRVERCPKLMIIPMIDIIFFLLVFFMMSSLNMVYQKTLSVNLPFAAAAGQAAEAPVAVTVSESGKLYWEQEEVTVAVLRERLRERVARQPKQPIILRADQSVEHGRVIAIMDEFKLAGVQKMAIAARDKQR